MRVFSAQCTTGEFARSKQKCVIYCSECSSDNATLEAISSGLPFFLNKRQIYQNRAKLIFTQQNKWKLYFPGFFVLLF